MNTNYRKNKTRQAGRHYQHRRPPAGLPHPKIVKEKKLKIIPLGGQEEVGRNMTIFEYDGDIVIVDMGLQFPEEDMPGIDYIIPDVSYLEGRHKDIQAVIFTHGHLDHIGAAPLLLQKLGYPPVVGRDLTLAMIKHRLEDHQKNSAQRLKTFQIKDFQEIFTFGSFKVRFFQVEHSIMDAVGAVLQTPTGTVVHPGDWTMEKNAHGQPLIDYSFLSRLPRPTLLMLESLGATDARPKSTSQEMKKNLSELIQKTAGRLIIGTFSSQIERIKWIFEIAEKHDKKIALDGYSMKMNVEIARQLGYIKIPKGVLVKVHQLDNYPDSRVIVLCTGSQGEGNAVLSRIIEGAHKHIRLRKADTVVLSSSIVPGNERTIQRLKDNLYRQCDNVIHGEIMDIHVSGHGNRADILYMVKTVKPDYYLPVYGNYYMLKEAAKLIKENVPGFSDRNVFVADNGQIIEMENKKAKLTNKKVPTNYVMVDGLGVGDVGQVVLRDRQAMAQDGMVVIIAQVSRQSGEVAASPDIISRGFIYMKESKKLLFELRQKVKEVVRQSTGGHNGPLETDFIKNNLRDEIGRFLFQKTERRPMILPVVIEV
ncbi:MAG: ribonuclease J [Candidatus Portnoybacteria bacterium CG10_big_fil_rev_8_21_14_0_10_44_7]|uniref:Ribonuclease J n=1 Tax=Candidatus Portnoybacteria bacterium CG10_big_fil_rev_8_21_14_0_10_44_7 TaxID=1974816 RepID=A0A2M8KJE2_9BACT|nr:MAG: ribonuclease J [Candidatus Portnoybacteria bacterium CG10_big_fil_rev_8_21_14_0_10_44_7]